MELPQPYLLFLGDVTEPTYAKTAFGLRDWARERCVGEWSCSDRTVTLGLPRLSPAQALIRRGYSDDNIAAILGGNFRRLLGATWT